GPDDDSDRRLGRDGVVGQIHDTTTAAAAAPSRRGTTTAARDYQQMGDRCDTGRNVKGRARQFVGVRVNDLNVFRCGDFVRRDLDLEDRMTKTLIFAQPAIGEDEVGEAAIRGDESFPDLRLYRRVRLLILRA